LHQLGSDQPLARGGRSVRGAGRDELRERLASVVEVVYLIFNEGYLRAADSVRFARTVRCATVDSDARC
jgi:predicted RNA polymerase sigma factor